MLASRLGAILSKSSQQSNLTSHLLHFMLYALIFSQDFFKDRKSKLNTRMNDIMVRHEKKWRKNDRPEKTIPPVGRSLRLRKCIKR